MLKPRQSSDHFSHIFLDPDAIAHIWVVGEIIDHDNTREDQTEVIIDVILIKQLSSVNWLDCTKEVCENDDYSKNLIEKIIAWHEEGVLSSIDPQSIC